jgi:hypothetical protein
MNDREKKLKPLDRHLRRKRGLSFSYLMTVALMVWVIFVAMKFDSQGKGAPTDPIFETVGH